MTWGEEELDRGDEWDRLEEEHDRELERQDRLDDFTPAADLPPSRQPPDRLTHFRDS